MRLLRKGTATNVLWERTIVEGSASALLFKQRSQIEALVVFSRPKGSAPPHSDWFFWALNGGPPQGGPATRQGSAESIAGKVLCKNLRCN
jgi:hypothetical protein